MSKKSANPEVSAAAAALGSKGGKQGRAEAKRRDPEHYSVTLPEARRRAKTVRDLNQK